jgi:hypothetical protein
MGKIRNENELFYIEGTVRFQYNLRIAISIYGTSFKCVFVKTNFFEDSEIYYPTLVCCYDTSLVLGKPSADDSPMLNVQYNIMVNYPGKLPCPGKISVHILKSQNYNNTYIDDETKWISQFDWDGTDYENELFHIQGTQQRFQSNLRTVQSKYGSCFKGSFIDTKYFEDSEDYYKILVCLNDTSLVLGKPRVLYVPRRFIINPEFNVEYNVSINRSKTDPGKLSVYILKNSNVHILKFPKKNQKVSVKNWKV